MMRSDFNAVRVCKGTLKRRDCLLLQFYARVELSHAQMLSVHTSKRRTHALEIRSNLQLLGLSGPLFLLDALHRGIILLWAVCRS